MPTEDRRVGKLLPTPVTPAGTVCYTITIPDAVQYRAAFLGQLGVLGQALTWDHPTDGTECADCEEAAQLFRNAMYLATWSDECEAGMSCEDVANCIETSEAVQEAIADQIANNPANETKIYNTSIYGTPMSSSQASEPVITSPECGDDVLFGSVTQVLDQLDQNNRDFLEIIEVGTNTRERVSQVIAAIPLLETLPINEVIDYVDKIQSEILENYEAQWTTSLRDEYRCDLFCIARDKPECELSFDDLFQYYNDRLGAALEPINFFVAVTNYFLLGTWAGTTVVDIMMLVQLGTWREASSWVGVSLRTLQTVGALGANSPDPDWEILCEDCAPDAPNITFIETPGVSGFDGTPKTFIENTLTGGSTWDLTFHNTSGAIAVAVNAQIGGIDACVRVTNTNNVLSYQHLLCAGGGDAGVIENPATAYGPSLGWFGAAGGTVMRVTVEPV